MIRATFYKNVENGSLVGFNIKGHSGYAESGSDIVCASVSSMTMLFLNMIEVVLEICSDSYELNVNEKKAEIDFKIDQKNGFKSEIFDAQKAEQISKALSCLMECIKSVSEEYSSFVKVAEKAVK